MRKYHIALVTCLPALFLSTLSHAVLVSIDSFSVSGTNSNGLFSFADGFSDGTPPPCGPAGCATQPTFYGVNSINPLPAESNGLLQLDSSNGIAGVNAGGGARIDETVQVSGSKSELLSSGGTISMSGTFTLPALSGPLNNGYGIRFIDAPFGSGAGTNGEVLELNVQYWTGNASNPAGEYIRYLVQDFNLDTITTVGADLINIPSGADEICLSMSRGAGSFQFVAGYSYLTAGGSCGALTSLGSAEGFLYEPYVRGQFQAFETAVSAVPEPGTWSLMGLGLIALAATRRRVAS